jgi:uncharacterized membrane protein
MQRLGATALAFSLISGTGIDLLAGCSGQCAEQAMAKSSSGGRSRGGSFEKRSTPSKASRFRNSNNDYDYSLDRGSSSTIIYSSSGRSASTDMSWLGVLLLMGATAAVATLVYLVWRASKQPSTDRELNNDIVTVTQLQIALLAQDKQIQTELTKLVETGDTKTPEGLTELLQESALALLRSPENWTHVRAKSQTVKSRQEAAKLFEQVSITERSKIQAETLVNLNGQVQRQVATLDAEAEPAAYIVVTLHIGSEDDQPLFNEIHSAEELITALRRLATITPDYLLIFELLWHPQDIQDSLSRDQLLADYPDLLQIA